MLLFKSLMNVIPGDYKIISSMASLLKALISLLNSLWINSKKCLSLDYKLRMENE